MADPWKIVAGTGHRELSGTADQAWTADQITRAATWLRDRAGTTAGISGMSRGFDLDWAEAILDAGLRLWACLPFEEQAARWNRADRARWERVRAAAERERVVGRIPDDVAPKHRSAVVNRLLHRRNRMMLDFSGALLTVWEPGRLDGGTAATLTEAGRRRMPGVHLDPIARRVAFALPDPEALVRYALENTRCGHIARVGAHDDLAHLYAEMLLVASAQWRIRPAKARETFDHGCDNCLADLAAAATARAVAA